MRLVDRPAARELAGYVLVGGVVFGALGKLREIRDLLRWAIHKAAVLVPEPEVDEEPE